MKTNAFSLSRRSFIINILASGPLGITGIIGSIRTTSAMGTLSSYPKGIQKVKGEVKINGILAKVGRIVKPGDTVTTGPDSLSIFVIGKSVYLVRDNTRVDLSSETSNEFKEDIVNVLRIVYGKMLSVFGRGRRRIVTPTAVVGVRGSGVYIEAEPKHTYICVCYGTADIEAKAAPSIKETVKTTHHESPRYVYELESRQFIVKAPVKNHTDAELIMLERIVWRQPPFVESEMGDETRGFGVGQY